MEFAGGNVMGEGKNAISVTNITPDMSGISYYDEALFLKVMRTGHVGARQLNPIMPWVYLRNMRRRPERRLRVFANASARASHSRQHRAAHRVPEVRQVRRFGERN